LLVIAGSLRLAARTDRQFSLYWPENDQFACPFDRLFTNSFIMVREPELHLLLRTEFTVKFYNAWRNGHPLFTEIASDGDPHADIVVIKGWYFPRYVSERCDYALELDIRSHLVTLQPSAEILAEVDSFALPPNAVGVHIRRGDHIEDFGESRDEHFVAIIDALADTKSDLYFFLATDDPATERRFQQRYRDRLLTFRKRGAGRHDIRGGQEALIDLLLLSRTMAIVGNVRSTFSLTAAKWGGKPVVCANESAAGSDLDRTCEQLLGNAVVRRRSGPGRPFASGRNWDAGDQKGALPIQKTSGR
jgi:hypothetical protein